MACQTQRFKCDRRRAKRGKKLVVAPPTKIRGGTRKTNFWCWGFRFVGMEGEIMELPWEAKERVVHLFDECNKRLTEFEKLADEGYGLLDSYRQGLGFLRRPLIKNSDLVENIIKTNKTTGLKCYFGEITRCKNANDVVENINKLNACHAGLLHHLTKAKALVNKLEMLVEETVSLIQSTSDTENQYYKVAYSFLDEVATSTPLKESVILSSSPQDYKASEYALTTCLICNMVRQEYKMQEKIITSLKFNDSEELESYCFMWSLRPNFDDYFLAMVKDNEKGR